MTVGSLYKPKLKTTGVDSAILWLSYYNNGKRVRESSGTEN